MKLFTLLFLLLISSNAIAATSQLSCTTTSTLISTGQDSRGFLGTTGRRTIRFQNTGLNLVTICQSATCTATTGVVLPASLAGFYYEFENVLGPFSCIATTVASTISIFEQ